MSDRVVARIREALGVEAVDHDPQGRPRVAPESTESVARALTLAREEGWKVRVEGRGTWLAPDAPAELVLTTVGLDRVQRVAAEDLVATVQAGISLAALGPRLAEAGMWLPWDPPGRPERSVGSVIASGTAGPLRQGFGPVRDHVLGCTLVTGDGRVVRPGGAVVKNVAGYDLTRLQVGGFGAFGVLTDAHLRLRAAPAADRTVIATGPRDPLTSAARDLVAAAVDASSLELLSPALGASVEWVLAVRLTGTEAGVAAEAERLRSLAPLEWRDLDADPAGALWHSAALGALSGPVTVRLGVLLEGIDETLDLLAEQLDLGLVSAGAGTGTIRWTGEGGVERLRALRIAAARREIPLTLERAPWALRRAIGHFGAYREGVGGLVSELRAAFDPGGTLRVALQDEEARGQ